jgi:integrase
MRRRGTRITRDSVCDWRLTAHRSDRLSRLPTFACAGVSCRFGAAKMSCRSARLTADADRSSRAGMCLAFVLLPVPLDQSVRSGSGGSRAHTEGCSKPLIKELLTKAGLPDTIRFHDLRHFAAITLLSNGADISITQAVLGHPDASVTLIFTHTQYQGARGLWSTMWSTRHLR